MYKYIIQKNNNRKKNKNVNVTEGFQKFAVSFIVFTVFPPKKTFRIMIAGWIFNMLKG